MGLDKLRQGSDKNIVLETCPVCKGAMKYPNGDKCGRCKGTGKLPSAKR